MTDAVQLLVCGGPDSLDDIPAYLDDIAANLRETLRRIADPTGVKVIFTDRHS